MVSTELFGIIASFKYDVFINDKEFIRVTDCGIVYVSAVLPGGYVNNIVPSFENNTPFIEENDVFAGSTVIPCNLGKFENINPVVVRYVFTSMSFVEL